MTRKELTTAEVARAAEGRGTFSITVVTQMSISCSLRNEKVQGRSVHWRLKTGCWTDQKEKMGRVAGCNSPGGMCHSSELRGSPAPKMRVDVGEL